ncbi:protein kinase [Streptomyces sp. NPDC048680]|uniref:protein kinase n=1 Tax=Streptomyces sp. NPDC048680 TaxID=3155492 RepID=UPI0034468AE0
MPSEDTVYDRRFPLKTAYRRGTWGCGRPGSILDDRYRLVHPLGRGGMGEAQDASLRRPVAVKVISVLAGGGSRADEARARFLREARITAALQHPHIVTVHDLGEAATGQGATPFLVMELLRGEGLDAVVRRGPVGEEEVARWGRRCATRWVRLMPQASSTATSSPRTCSSWPRGA